METANRTRLAVYCAVPNGNTRSGWRRQKLPDFMQQRLKCLPDPHGHGSLRPSFSTSSLSPCTNRKPRLTCVSDGKPFLRLLVTWKARLVDVFSFHDRSPYKVPL